MTESEFIKTTDLRAIDCALGCLHRVVPANNDAIDAERFRKIVGSLRKMREDISASIGPLKE